MYQVNISHTQTQLALEQTDITVHVPAQSGKKTFHF